jgi:hypothetical protein
MLYPIVAYQTWNAAKACPVPATGVILHYTSEKTCVVMNNDTKQLEIKNVEGLRVTGFRQPMEMLNEVA